MDPHTEILLGSLEGMYRELAQISGASDPVQAVETALTEIVAELCRQFAQFEPVQVVEVARAACLPWSAEGQTYPDPQAMIDAEGGPTRAELIALLAATGVAGKSTLTDDAPAAHAGDSWRGRAPLALGEEEADALPPSQSLSQRVHEALPLIDRILHLTQLHEIAQADREDTLGMIAAMMRGSEVWMRNSSYPDMVAATLRQLFSQPQLSEILRADLGFDAKDAICVLETCHALQVEHFNDRLKRMLETLHRAMASGPIDDPDPGWVAETSRAWQEAWEPEADTVTISADEIAAAASLSEFTVQAVLKHFTLDVAGWTPREIVDKFTSGNNPLRTHPVIRTSNGRVMLVHDAHILPAIRENLERHLKTATVWESYQKFRGDLLETRTRAAFERVLPFAKSWEGFEYYIPADDSEVAGDPSGYSKRVEGDHLIIQDDVALIVEDKAVTISQTSRTGETRRLRRDLTGIIKKASEQASRLQDRMQQDGGVRIHNEGWVDFSNIREIHTVAVSLDDLSFASTATAELVKAGLIDSDRIPWTVSLHDLDLITLLVDRPAEFLLYLRRRRDPEATVFYTSSDELDLFLYFFEAGLYVEPDPEKVREAMPFMPPPTADERRRRRQQVPTLITSRTDALDRWHSSQLAHQTDDSSTDDIQDLPNTAAGARAGESTVEAPSAQHETSQDPDKPAMVFSPLGDLIDTLQHRGDYAWLSIGATLLAGATAFQEKMARLPTDLLRNPSSEGRERSVAVPFGSSREEGWLLIWITRPPGRLADKFQQDTQDYLRVKMHQLLLPRGAVFVYDETTKELADVYFDDHKGELEPRLQARLRSLKPVGHFDKWGHSKKRPKV
jgi:hypothetical protein